MFALGCAPQDSLRRLNVYISGERPKHDDWRNNLQSITDATVQNAAEKIEGLCYIAKPDGFCLNLIIDAAHPTSAAKYIRALVPIIRKFNSKGMVVTVHSDDDVWYCNSHTLDLEGSLHATSRSLTPRKYWSPSRRYRSTGN